MGLSLMEFGEMTMNDVRAVARLYNELACLSRMRPGMSILRSIA